MYRCIYKSRDKNGVIQLYTIENTDNGMRTNIAPNDLKIRIQSGKLKISNLTLTSDNRLVDHDDSETIKQENRNKMIINKNKQMVFDAYNNGSNTAQVNYALRKTQSKRVGRLVTKALLIGLTCASLSGTLTACGSVGPMDVNATGIEQQVELSTQDKINLLNSTTEIDVDIKNFTANKQAEILVDDISIGTMSGKFIKLFDTLTFKDGDNLIATGEQEVHLLFDGWTISDADGNVMYRMKEDFQIGVTKYTIYDVEDNEVGWLKEDFLSLSKSAKIYDKNNKLIATIEQSMFRKDFTIKVEEGCEIDNVSLSSICVNYMINELNQKSHSNHHNNSKN